jgi:hypothetical protein
MSQRTLLRTGILLALTAALLGAYAAPATAAPAVDWWKPRAATTYTWQWQLNSTLDVDVDAGIYVVDAVGTTTEQVSALRAGGGRAVCHFSAGVATSAVPDRAAFPAVILGYTVSGSSARRWVDIRRWDVLRPIMAARMAACRAKGFDAVDPADVDGYTRTTGFRLTAADQLVYNRRIAAVAHRAGLGVALHNDMAQAATLAPAFDFALDERCRSRRTCDRLAPFTRAGKPVLQVEYTVAVEVACTKARMPGIVSILKRTALDAWRQTC